MERTETFQFSDDELDTLESALALYAAYSHELNVNMLVGDESDVEEVRSDHNRAKEMHKQLFELTHDHSYQEEREMFHETTGRPMDLSDFSPFDWCRYMQGELNR